MVAHLPPTLRDVKVKLTMKKRLWMHKNVWEEFRRTGEYRDACYNIPADLLYYGTKQELIDMSANIKDWRRFKLVKTRKKTHVVKSCAEDQK